VSGHGDSSAISIVASKHANNRWAPLWLEGNAIADSELKHTGMRVHLIEKAKALNNAVVQID
jgi:hypothetical protein